MGYYPGVVGWHKKTIKQKYHPEDPYTGNDDQKYIMAEHLKPAEDAFNIHVKKKLDILFIDSIAKFINDLLHIGTAV